ncbi:MAG: hypothetical protein KC410_03410 [Anaerolineales bacterium]|nr:hypothetical protein [Anaerolineales bacterium]
MNPYSRFLGQKSNNQQFLAFVEQWDKLERLIIDVYRGKMTAAAATAGYEQVWPWLKAQYPRWEATLQPYWQLTKAAGQTTNTDPFRLLLAIDSPAHIPGDWRAMQHLPAAREAINRYLVDSGDKTKV